MYIELSDIIISGFVCSHKLCRSEVINECEE